MFATKPRVLDPLAAVLTLGLLAGALIVWMWPGAIGHHAVLGWWPLWLVGMPASALLLHHLRRAMTAQRTILAAPLRRHPRRQRRRVLRRPAGPRRRWLLAALDMAPG